MSGPAQVRVRLLGGLTVEGLDEHAVGSRKGRTLLKVLALARGAPVGADRIADVLWGEELPARPGEQVAVLVSRLRGVLGADRLPRTDAGYALRCDWLDVDELAARVAEAERRHAAGQAAAALAVAEAALALVRGPLLPDEGGEWVDADRAAAEGLARRAELVVAEAAVAAGQPGAAVAAAESVLAAAPYDEAALRALMRAHVAAARPAAALAAYARVRERLADDLGTDPAPETEELHYAILRGDAVAAAPARPAPPPLAGRDRELAELLAALDATQSVVVEGEPGIGKTALLGAAAAAAEARGFAVVRCVVDPLGHDLPLQPLLDPLAAVVRGAGAEGAADALGPDADVVALLLGRPPAADPTATLLPDAAAGRTRLFASLLAAYERVAAGRPLLVVVDDLHLADSPTAAWLDFAARRGDRVAVLAAVRSGSGRRLDARVVQLGPLDEAAAALVVGPERAADLHRRSGGNPLFLVELARSPEGVPEGVREAIAERARALGDDVVRTLSTAAVLGPDVDLDLLAAVLARPVADLLADAEAALGAALLAERGSSYAFAADLVREALAGTTTAARRAYVHREAALALAARPGADPRAVAWHARRGGDAARAATALTTAAVAAAQRYDHDEAERLLDDAVRLHDTARVRLARGRVRLARWDLTRAGADADRAIELGAGAAAFELRGWVAYYERDYAAAQRYADEGAELADDETVRASCLALGGRTRHARGDLGDARPRLAEAAGSHVPAIRGVAQVWLSTLTAHDGHPDEARELAERALLDPDRFAHPFGRFHGEFARTLAVGMQGHAHDTALAAARFETEATRAGPQGARFVPIAMNFRAWPLRATGRFGEAADLLRAAVERATGDVTLAEPYYVGRLDLAETLLLAGDVAGAGEELDRLAPGVTEWSGTMSWRARQRLALLRARHLLATGDPAGARELAVPLAAAAPGEGRHALLARALAAQAGDGTPAAEVAALLGRLERCAGLEGWLVTAQLAAAYGVDAWWRDAERRAAGLVAGAGPNADDARRYVGRALDALRR